MMTRLFKFSFVKVHSLALNYSVHYENMPTRGREVPAGSSGSGGAPSGGEEHPACGEDRWGRRRRVPRRKRRRCDQGLTAENMQAALMVENGV